MDQASLLREMMNKLQQKNVHSVAVLSTSDSINSESFTERMVRFYAQKEQKNISLLGIEKNEQTLERFIQGKESFAMIQEQLSPYCKKINGKLDFVSSIRNQQQITKTFIETIKKIEEQSEELFYFAGFGLNLNVINLSLAAEKVILLMEPTEISETEAINFVKIFSKIKGNHSFGVVVNTFDQRIFEEQIKKIQDYASREFNYKIEPIGFFDTKYLALLEDKKIFEDFNFHYLKEYKERKNFSDSISSMMF